MSGVCSSDLREAGSVAAGLKAIQPFLDIARTPANLAGADVVGAGEVTFAHAAIDGRARLEAGDVEHVGDGQKLVLIRRHCVVLSFTGMLDVPPGSVERYSVPHSREFIDRKSTRLNSSH